MALVLRGTGQFQEEGVAKRTKLNHFNELKVSLTRPPAQELLDLNGRSATAVNQYDYQFNDFQVPSHPPIDEAKYQFVEMTINKRGAYEYHPELIERMLGWIHFVDMPSEDTYELNNEHYLNVFAEANRGLKTIQTACRSVNRHAQMPGAGANTNGRQYAMERDTNPKKFPELFQGLPFDEVDAQEEVENVERVNDIAVESIPLFPANIF